MEVNVVVHSENCKVEILLDITAQQLSKKNCHMTGIYEASKARFIRRISADFCRVECN